MKYGVDRSVLKRVAIEDWFDVALDEDRLLAVSGIRRVLADELPDDSVTTDRVVITQCLAAGSSAQSPKGVASAGIQSVRGLKVECSGVDRANTVQDLVDRQDSVAVHLRLLVALDEYELLADSRCCSILVLECPNDSVTTHLVVVGHCLSASSNTDAPDGIVEACESERSVDVQVASRDDASVMQYDVDRIVLQRVAIHSWHIIILDEYELFTVGSVG